MIDKTLTYQADEPPFIHDTKLDILISLKVVLTFVNQF
jgi:hypothetical protein